MGLYSSPTFPQIGLSIFDPPPPAFLQAKKHVFKRFASSSFLAVTLSERVLFRILTTFDPRRPMSPSQVSTLLAVPDDPQAFFLSTHSAE